MKKIHLLIMIALVFSTSIFAQEKVLTEITKEIKLLKSKPIKVVLLKENKEFNKQFNSFLKQAIESEYTFNSNITFISQDEYKADKKNKESNYAYIEAGKAYTGTAKSPGPTYLALFYLRINKKGKTETAITHKFDMDKKNTLADYYVGVQNFQFKLNSYSEQKLNDKGTVKMSDRKESLADEAVNLENSNIEKLKSTTLLVYEDIFKGDVASKFGEVYPYPYKIVSKNVIDDAIVSNDKTKTILSSKTITNADTGELMLNFSVHKGKKTIVAPFGIGGGLFKTKFNEEDLDRLVSYL